MASKYWIKLYHEILHDPKMGQLPDRLWRRAIELFLLAGEFDRNGELPATSEICWTLRINKEECNETLQQLQRLGVAHCNADTTWVITHFADRQAANSSTERSRAHRERKRQEAQLKPLRNGQNSPNSQGEQETKVQRNVAPDTDTDTDITTASRSDETASEKLTDFYLTYISNGKTSQSVIDMINDMLETYKDVDVIYAIDQAIKNSTAENNKCTLAYIEAICKRRATGKPDEKPAVKGYGPNGHAKPRTPARAAQPIPTDTEFYERWSKQSDE